MMDTGNRIIRKDGKWKKGRFATVISPPNPDRGGEFMARFGQQGKFFVALAKFYVVLTSPPDDTIQEG